LNDDAEKAQREMAQHIHAARTVLISGAGGLLHPNLGELVG
jgi:hypothetical protein